MSYIHFKTYSHLIPVGAQTLLDLPPDILVKILTTPEVEERYRDFFKQEEPDTCWDWTVSHPKEYGKFKFGPFTIVATRAGWIIANKKPIPDGMFLCHTCDRPPCVNQNHLFLGTHRDNMLDKLQKTRLVANKQLRVLAETKISEADKELRELAKDWGLPYEMLYAAQNNLPW